MRVLYLSLAIVIIDQISKIFVKGFSIPFLNIHHQGLYHGESVPVIGDFFRITFVENPGMAFGIDIDPGVRVAIAIFSLAASIGLVFYLYSIRHANLSMRAGLALILGGAIGNFIDRVFYGVAYGYESLFYGRVVDFLSFDFFDFELFGKAYERWPIFNVADVAVSLGVLTLIIFYKSQDDEEETETEEKDMDKYTISSENTEVTEPEVKGDASSLSFEKKEDDSVSDGESDNGENNKV